MQQIGHRIKTPIELLKRIVQPQLWLHLHPYALTAAVYDPGQNKVIEFNAQVHGQDPSKALSPETLAAFFESNSQLQQLNYHKVIVAAHSETFTILPEKSEQPGKVLEALGYELLPDDHILVEAVRPDFLVYYTLPDAVVDFMEHRFPEIHWHFGDLGSILYDNPKLTFKDHLAAHLYGEDLSIVLKRAGQVQFFNKFRVKAKEDLLYYIRLAYEELQLNPNEFATYLYGFIEEKSPAFSTSYGYIRNFEIDRTLKHGLGYRFIDENMPLHYYLHVLALGKCA